MAPCSATRSSSSSATCWIRGRCASTRRGVNAWRTSPRSRVWSGGSRASIDRVITGRTPCGIPSLASRGSPSARSTSSYRMTSHSRPTVGHRQRVHRRARAPLRVDRVRVGLGHRGERRHPYVGILHCEADVVPAGVVRSRSAVHVVHLHAQVRLIRLFQVPHRRRERGLRNADGEDAVELGRDRTGVSRRCSLRCIALFYGRCRLGPSVVGAHIGVDGCPSRCRRDADRQALLAASVAARI